MDWLSRHLTFTVKEHWSWDNIFTYTRWQEKNNKYHGRYQKWRLTLNPVNKRVGFPWPNNISVDDNDVYYFLAEECHYRKGIKHGLERHYSSPNIICFETMWDQGLMTGESIQEIDGCLCHVNYEQGHAKYLTVAPERFVSCARFCTPTPGNRKLAIELFNGKVTKVTEYCSQGIANIRHYDGLLKPHGKVQLYRNNKLYEELTYYQGFLVS